jgi:DtxR family transcriptional regulator, Mn-dependent transcriptional regulator
MAHPLIALGIFFVVSWLGWYLFWPDRGKFWAWRKLLSTNDRVLIEDYLKHVFECEYDQEKADPESIRKHLKVSGIKADAIIHQIESKKLGVIEAGELRLTDEGRDYALRIIRAHRLWEKYLSEKTGVPEKNWHKEAERREHQMTLEDTEKLAYELGNPLFDPHGDPIPTATGEIAAIDAISITDLEAGEVADIAHIEDEPYEFYEQVSAEGLAAGNRVKILEKTDTKIRFFSEGNEYVLGKSLARIISVQPLAKEVEVEDLSGYRTLDTLQPGETARVLRISPSCRGLERRRLMDFGIVPGTEVVSELHAIGKDPVAYRVRGTLVALRNQQASHIFIAPKEEVA